MTGLRRRCHHVAALALLGLAAAAHALPALAQTSAQTAAQTAASARYDQARDAYEIGHFADAFASFAALADEGHCAATRTARDMLRFGRPLYGMAFSVAAERLRRWELHCPVAALAAR